MTSPLTIAVGYDGSSESEMAIRWALYMAVATNAHVTVVHATGLLEHAHIRFSPDAAPDALLAIARECGFDADHLYWVVNDGDACSVLLRAEGPPIGADMLVVGSRGHGKRPGILLGSTSLEVAEHATVPVVVVPPNIRGSVPPDDEVR
jgi:nucleotide-binding universal stress UspA family protein